MSVVKILVEGKDDIVFLCRIIDLMRGSIGPVKWQVVSRDNKVTVRDKWFGNCYAELGSGVIAIEELRGVYVNRALPPSLTLVKTATKELKVDQIVGIFDADSKTNFLGHKVPYGGLPQRRSYIERAFSSIGIGKKFFFVPNDSQDKTMEDLMLAIIKPMFRFIVDDRWPQYRADVKNALRAKGIPSLDYGPKCTISQFSSIIDENVAKDLYWIDALFNDEIWDWDSVELIPLKEFLRDSVPSLFR